MKDHGYFMKIAAEEARKGMNAGEGGPFGACIVSADGEVVSAAHNQVLTNDCTAHAEIQAIRLACKKLGTYDLKGNILYATGQPCPMCLSAIIWSNLDGVYYANTVVQAEEIGFRDAAIYEYLKGNRPELLKCEHVPMDECARLYEEYKDVVY